MDYGCKERENWDANNIATYYIFFLLHLDIVEESCNSNGFSSTLKIMQTKLYKNVPNFVQINPEISKYQQINAKCE